MNRMYYTIENHAEGKLVHYLCFFAEVDGMVDVTELCWAYVPAADLADNINLLYEVEEESTQYVDRVTEEEATRYADLYYGDEGGIHLPITEVNGNTPYGNYWCEY